MQKLLMLMMALLLVSCGGADTDTADEESSQSSISNESAKIFKDEREGIIPGRMLGQFTSEMPDTSMAPPVKK